MDDHRVSDLLNKLDDILVLDKDLPSYKTCSVTFVDFAPTIKFEKYINKTKSVKYKELVEFCNKWLQTKGCWDVIGCETIPSIVKIVVNEWADIEKIELRLRYSLTRERPIKGKAEKNRFKFQFMVQTLRLWIRPFIINCPIDLLLQIIPEVGYKDFVPKRIYHDDFQKFENIDSVVERVNQSIRNGEIHGKIISVQTLGCYAEKDWSIDEECTQSKRWESQMVFILRVFYTLGPKQEEEIGLTDFVPQLVIGKKDWCRKSYESQHSVFWSAYIWLRTRPAVNFINFSSVDVKMKSIEAETIDTKQMSMTRNTGQYVRFRRLIYAKPKVVPLGDTSITRPNFSIDSKHFIMHDHQFKSKVAHSMKREWEMKMFKPTPHILCCETVLLFSERNENQSMKLISPMSLSYKSRHPKSSTIICYRGDVQDQSNSVALHPRPELTLRSIFEIDFF